MQPTPCSCGGGGREEQGQGPRAGKLRAAGLGSGAVLCRWAVHLPSAGVRPAGLGCLCIEHTYYLRCVSLKRAPGDQHRITPNAHPTAPWPMGLGWGVSGDNLYATFMPRLCVYGRLLAPPSRGGATGIGR